MKAFIQRCEQVVERIEMGFCERAEAMRALRALRNEAAERFGEGSDEFVQVVEVLLGGHEIASNL